MAPLHFLYTLLHIGYDINVDPYPTFCIIYLCLVSRLRSCLPIVRALNLLYSITCEHHLKCSAFYSTNVLGDSVIGALVFKSAIRVSGNKWKPRKSPVVGLDVSPRGCPSVFLFRLRPMSTPKPRSCAWSTNLESRLG